MLNAMALIILILLILAGVVFVVMLGGLPGMIATKRGHPQADAIRVCGWMGLLTLGILWPVALVWAYMRHGEPRS